MKAVILAGGKSTRCYPLTLTKPKPLLEAANQSILEHNLEQLQGLVEEAIVITGFKGEMIRERFSSQRYEDIKLTFVEQKEQLGSGHALLQAREWLKGKFLVLNGDDFFAREDLEKCLQSDLSLLAAEVAEPGSFGIFEFDENNLVKGLEEKPLEPKSNLANTGAYVLDERVFDFELAKTERGEFELVDFLSALLEKGESIACKKVSGYWLPIRYPWDLLKANEFFVSYLRESYLKGTVEKHAVINGHVFLGKHSVIRSGAYIEGNVVIGENCVIGPNCLIRGNTSIGNDCYVGNAVEVKNSIIGHGTKIGHLSYCADSIIGENCNFGAGTITANLRHDQAGIKMTVKGNRIDSGRRKLGVIMADNCKTGIHTSFYPGRTMNPGTFTLPGEVVKADKE